MTVVWEEDQDANRFVDLLENTFGSVQIVCRDVFPNAPDIIEATFQHVAHPGQLWQVSGHCE